MNSRVFSLSLLQYLSDNGFGTIDVDLLWQKSSLDREGVYISDIGDNQSRGSRPTQSFEIYSRGKNDLEGQQKLNNISEFLYKSLGGVINLPAVTGYTEDGFDCIEITSISKPTNVGQDNQGRVIFAITGQARINN